MNVYVIQATPDESHSTIYTEGINDALSIARKLLVDNEDNPPFTVRICIAQHIRDLRDLGS